MDFFGQQEQARRQTRTLVILFVLAVFAIVAAVNIVAALLWLWAQGGGSYAAARYPHGFFFANTGITIALIAGGTWIEIFNLRDGGDAVAQMAGGRLVSPATRDLQERRLLNVVEEMALASGIACPKVYVLDREESINAFAAGYNPNEAVVAVTQGTLRRLTRDELQGVVGHEFSHILNGDMRLNVRLIGVLFGIQMVNSFGRHLLDFASRVSLSDGRSRSRDDRGPSLQAILFVLGVALVVIGYIGVFFGRLIKAAVSRQREFLADASAVQFTRNPDGIGGALRKIGGLSRKEPAASRIHHPNAEQLSHLFLSAVRPSLLSGFLATHPPIPERLRRIYGKSVELLDAPERKEPASGGDALPDIPYLAPGLTATSDVSPVNIATSTATSASTPSIAFGRSIVQQARLSPELDSAVHDPQAACALVYALLLEREVQPNPQRELVQRQMPQQAAFIVYLADAVAQLPKGARLPLLDLAMPALRELSQGERAHMLTMVDQLIAADNKVTLAEFVLQTVLTRRLSARAGRAVPVKYSTLAALKAECAILLSLVAQIVARTERAPVPQASLAAFLRGAALLPELGLAAADLRTAADIGFGTVRQALDRGNQLAPLVKPALIKALTATAGTQETLPIELADVLRAICAALEAPLPPAVADAYAQCALAA